MSGLSIDAILETKRDGGALSEAQIQAFIDAGVLVDAIVNLTLTEEAVITRCLQAPTGWGRGRPSQIRYLSVPKNAWVVGWLVGRSVDRSVGWLVLWGGLWPGTSPEERRGRA